VTDNDERARQVDVRLVKTHRARAPIDHAAPSRATRARLCDRRVSAGSLIPAAKSSSDPTPAAHSAVPAATS